MSTRFFRLCLKLLRGGVAVSFIFSLALVSAAEAKVCFLPQAEDCLKDDAGPDPDPDKCPTGYTAYASKPDCGIGKKVEQSGMVNGKGCYKCADEESSDCSQGKLEKDLGTCVKGKIGKEVGETNSGLKCYECVDDVCPSPYANTKAEAGCNSVTSYPAEVNGTTKPSEEPCYECKDCSEGEHYESKPSDNCYDYTKVDNEPCWTKKLSSYAESDNSCPTGMQLDPCGEGETQKATGASDCGKTCYKCEADSDESEDPFAQCKFDLLTLSRGEYESEYGTYAAGPLHGRVFKMSDIGMFKEITVGDYKEELLSKYLDMNGQDSIEECSEDANDECYQKLAELIEADIDWMNDQRMPVFPAEFNKDNNDILKSIIKCDNGYIDLSAETPWDCSLGFQPKAGGFITNEVVVGDYIVLPEGFFMHDKNDKYNIDFSCEPLRTAKCPEGTTEINSSSNYCKSPRNDYYRSKICQPSVFEKESNCGYYECISDVQGKHMGRISYTDDPAYVTEIEKDPSTGDEVFADVGYYYECGCVRGTQLWANECICPVDKIWDETKVVTFDDEEPTEKGKCVYKKVNKITITPKINVDTASVQCKRSENGSSSSITYTFPVREIEINVKSEEAVNEEVNVYMWIIDAAYRLRWDGEHAYEYFAPQEFTRSSSYQLVNCTIKKGENSCSESKGGFTVKTASSYEGTYVWNGHTYDTGIRCPAELNLDSNSEDEFSPMIIPYRYIGVISSADDTYRYTADINPESWSNDLHVKFWFGETLAQQIKNRSNRICPHGTWNSAPVCRPYGMQGDWGKGSWYNSVMSRLTSQKQPEREYIKDKKYNEWLIEELNYMPYRFIW